MGSSYSLRFESFVTFATVLYSCNTVCALAEDGLFRVIPKSPLIPQFDEVTGGLSVERRVQMSWT